MYQVSGMDLEQLCSPRDALVKDYYQFTFVSEELL